MFIYLYYIYIYMRKSKIYLIYFYVYNIIYIFLKYFYFFLNSFGSNKNNNICILKSAKLDFQACLGSLWDLLGAKIPQERQQEPNDFKF